MTPLPESSFELRDQEIHQFRQNGRVTLGGRYPKPETAPRKLVTLFHEGECSVGKVLEIHFAQDGKADVLVELVKPKESRDAIQAPRGGADLPVPNGA